MTEIQIAEEEHARDSVDLSDTQDTSSTITSEDAKQLAASTLPSLVLQVLKKSDFDLARRRVFAGFRVGTDFLKNPIGRGRFATELINDPKLVKAIQESSAQAQPLKPEIRPTPSLIPAAPKPPAPHPDEKLIAERDRLRKEFRDTTILVGEQKSKIAELEKMLHDFKSKLDELSKLDVKATARDKGRQKQILRLENEIQEAKAALREQAKPVRGESSEQSRSGTTTDNFAVRREARLYEALERLLSRGRADIVMLVAEEILHQDSADHRARQIQALAKLSRGDRQGAMDDLRLVFDSYLKSGDHAEAARTLVKTVSVSHEVDTKMAIRLFSALAKQPANIMQATGQELGLLAGTNAYSILKSCCLPDLAQRLFPDPGGQSVGLLPLPMRQALADDTMTVQRLINAIDRNDERILHLVREAFLLLDKPSREDTELMLTEQADDSYFTLVSRRTLKGPSVVDASNVANYERELMVSHQPRLSNILAVRYSLRSKAYFPVVVIADANLPHVIDDKQRVQQLIRNDEIMLVLGGTDADEVIVREARRLHSIIVTNDYMTDWDLNDEMNKVQYSISLTDGRATLYF